MGIKRCLIVISNYGTSFVPGFAWTSSTFPKKKRKTWSHQQVDTIIDKILLSIFFLIISYKWFSPTATLNLNMTKIVLRRLVLYGHSGICVADEDKTSSFPIWQSTQHSFPRWHHTVAHQSPPGQYSHQGPREGQKPLIHILQWLIRLQQED